MPDYYVYLLIDPRDGMPFYVGKGKNGRAWYHTEIARHWIKIGCPNDYAFACDNRHKIYKIRKILMAGLEPAVEILVRTESEEEALRLEAEKIAEIGLGNLTNVRSAGVPSTFSAESRVRRSESMKKMWADPEFRDRMKRIHKARVDDNFRAWCSKRSKRMWKDPAYRKKQKASLRPPFLPGHEISEETRRKIGEANSNPSEETRQKMSKSQKARAARPEEKERRAEIARKTHTGRKRSENTKRRMSEAMRASHARRKALRNA